MYLFSFCFLDSSLRSRPVLVHASQIFLHYPLAPLLLSSASSKAQASSVLPLPPKQLQNYDLSISLPLSVSLSKHSPSPVPSGHLPFNITNPLVIPQGFIPVSPNPFVPNFPNKRNKTSFLSSPYPHPPPQDSDLGAIASSTYLPELFPLAQSAPDPTCHPPFPTLVSESLRLGFPFFQVVQRKVLTSPFPSLSLLSFSSSLSLSLSLSSS